MDRVRVFVSFDQENDRDLLDRLVVESRRPDSRFEVAGRSTGIGEAHARRGIHDVDEVIVVCGKQSDACVQMHSELAIVQELHKPYFMLWGRREVMCTRPLGSRTDDAMYGWSASIIHSQIVLTLRESQPRAVPEHYKKPPAKLAVVR
jgi:hypothetical protein